MIKLHVLGLNAEGTGVLLSARADAEKAGYVLVIDEHLRELVGTPKQAPASARRRQSAQRRPAAEAAPERAESEVPRAPLEGVDDAASAVGASKGLRLVRQRLGASELPLGEAVITNLAERGVRVPPEILDEGWSAEPAGEGVWKLSFSYLSRGRLHQVGWVLDCSDSSIRAENRSAEALGWWRAEGGAAPTRSGGRRRRRRGGRGRRGGSGGQSAGS